MRLGHHNVVLHNLRTHQRIHLIEHQHFHLHPMLVLDRDDRPRRAVLLGHAPIHRRNNAADLHLRTVFQLLRRHHRQGGVHLRIQGLFEPVQWVARHVQPQHVPLQRQLVFPIPRIIRHRNAEHVFGNLAFAPQRRKQVKLALVHGFLRPDRRIHRVFENHHEPLAGIPHGVERAGLNQGFGHPLIAGRQVDFFQVVGEVLIQPLRFSLAHN